MTAPGVLYSIKNLYKTREREKGYRLLISNLTVRRGDRIAITGPSGCGKSTTLDILGLSLRPDSAAEFTFAPREERMDIMKLWNAGAQDRLAGLRLGNLGYVLQSGELLPFLSTGENMMLTARLAGMAEAEAAATVKDLAARLGIDSLLAAKPNTLSVGERQRAAIIRALAARPQVILADEPTAALDPLHARRVMEAFMGAIQEFGSTLILVTHNAAWASAGGLTEIQFKLREDEEGTTAILGNGGEI